MEVPVVTNHHGSRDARDFVEMLTEGEGKRR